MIKKLRKQKPLLFYTRSILLLAMGMLIVNSSMATTWYVNDASLTGDVFTTAIGDDTNAGTAAAPFATIQFAITTAANGDTIYVDAGTYVEASITISKSALVLRGAKFGIQAGPAANPPGRGSDESVIQGSIHWGSAKDDVTMDGFTVDMGSGTRGIEAKGLNTTIINNIVTGTLNILVQQLGISTGPNAPNRTHSYLISHNNVQGVRFGIYMDGHFENPSLINLNYVSGCFSAGYTLTASNGHHFQANVATGNGTGLLVLKGGNTIDQNTFAGNLTNGIRIAGTAQNFGNVIMNNFITANGTGINLTEDDAAATNNQANYNFIVNPQNISSTHSADFNATCNWYGTTNAGLIAAQISGAVTFNPFLSDGIDSDPGTDGFQPITTCVVVPVVLLDFTAQVKNYDVLLNWQTASEVNSSHFNIERSLDNRNYTTIGTVQASGYSNLKMNYDFTDNKPVSFDRPVYYRIAMVDRDGSSKYTKIISIILKTNGAYVQSVYPNPVEAGKTLHTNFISGTTQPVSISFISATGQLLHTYEFQAMKGANDLGITIPANAAAGVNFLLIRSAGEVKKVPVYVH